ncbi:peptide ABC transporter substrate-binding protein [Lactobacillus sp. DCY120]|uniref:Peptide ABC transporter substrate-binding protein n=1 Tax=Bombilactobacillus apium TaxID=2675299 RepID=A0A850REL3_9LACO|nr:peptide ABC transporter substrate-binding protein [Bombilactobacillus apium]NVY97148.1 peptide ABC transporter substrate-binding protein [Bombilactobacillus apium]
MKLKKLLAVGTTSLLAVGFLAGCGSKQAQAPKDTVGISSKDIIATADSSLNTDNIGSQALVDTMEGLYRWKGKTLVPGVSTKIVKPTNNGLTYTFKLRKDSKWSNGDPVTAQDFVYAWKRTVDPKTKSQYAYIFEGIANAKDISAGKKPVDTMGVKAIDDHTFQVNLEKPIPYFNKLIANATFYPLQEKTVKKWGKKYGTNSKTMIFNGPYKLVNWNSPDNSWKETKNNKYWNSKAVKVKNLKYQVVKDNSTSVNLFQANKLDRAQVSGDTAKQMKDNKDYGEVKQNSTFFIEMNQEKNPLFKNQKIRQALSLALNRKQLVDKVLGSGCSPANSITPAKMAYDPQDNSKDFVAQTSKTGKANASYDLKKAKKLWKEGLAETGNTGKKLDLVLLGDDTDSSKKRDEFLQNQLGKLPGLKITINDVPFKSRLNRAISGDFDLVVTGWIADFPDPINFLTLFTEGASNNNGKWVNKEYNDLVKKSMNEDANNPAARWKDMQDAQNIINEQQGVIPLFQNGEAYLTHKRLKGVDFGSSGTYNQMSLYTKE